MLDVFTIYVFVCKMPLNEKSVKRIGQSVPKVEQHGENPLSSTDGQSVSGACIHHVAVSEVLQQYKCAY